MKMFAMALLTTVLSVSAFAHDNHPVPPPPLPPSQPLIVGEWQTDHPLWNGQIWIWNHFVFTARSMTMHATCEFRNPYVNLTVGVRSQVAYNQNYIYVHERSEASVNDGYRYCNAGLAPATWEFYFTGGDINHAVLFAPVPSRVRLDISRVMPADLK